MLNMSNCGEHLGFQIDTKKKVSYGSLQDYSNNIKFKMIELKRLLNQIALLAVGANVIPYQYQNNTHTFQQGTDEYSNVIPYQYQNNTHTFQRGTDEHSNKLCFQLIQ